MFNLIRKIVAILTRDEKKRIGMLMVLDIAISIADIVFLALLLFIIQFYTGSVRSDKISLHFTWLTAHNVILVILIFFLLFSGKNLAGFLIYRAQSRFVYQVASRISNNKLVNYLEGSYSGYINTDSSVQIREISYQPLEFSQHVLGGMQQIITQIMLVLLAIIAIISFNARLFLLLFLVLLPPVFGVFYLIKSKLNSVGKNARASSERSLQHLQEALSGFVESNIYDKNEVFSDRYITYQQQFNTYLSDHAIIQGIPPRMIEIFALLGIVILISINKLSGTADNSAVITIGVFMAAAYKIIPGIVKILNLHAQVNAYAFTVQKLAPADPITKGYNDPGGKNQIDPGEEMQTNTREERPTEIRSIQFKGVRFSYGDRLILCNQHLQLVPGDFIGIAGPSGRGKTTILNLLLGFLTPDKGEIIINGRTTQAAERRQYWSNISYVKQQPFLIHDTILHNITLNGQPDNEQKLQEVLAWSGLTGVIDSFPEKWNKVIAENGKNISGGQKQRIAVARALYKNANLIILDEPFSELDEESETSLLSYFRQLAQSGKMIILITHNRKSLSFCNKIVSLDETPS